MAMLTQIHPIVNTHWSRAKTLVPLDLYDRYVDQVTDYNLLRTNYTDKIIGWVSAFNECKDSQSAETILRSIPTNFSRLRRAMAEKLVVHRHLATAARWFASQPDLLKKEMRDSYPWSEKYRRAKMKWLLLTDPTAKTAQYVRHHVPGFYQQYLDYCQCPSTTLRAGAFTLETLPVWTHSDMSRNYYTYLSMFPGKVNSDFTSLLTGFLTYSARLQAESKLKC